MWRGSNAGGLFKALSRSGALIEVVDEFYFIPLSASSFLIKSISKILRPLYFVDFNRQIIQAFDRFLPDFVLVYKGAFVFPSTLDFFKSKGVKIINFYPDVSFHTHGTLLQKTLPKYDKIFTTKSFGAKDYQEQLGLKDVVFVPHGFDPEVHKSIEKEFIPSDYFCDVSFIGTYSPKKQKILEAITQRFPSINLKIWGTQWEKCTTRILYRHIQPSGVFGDLYAAAIGASKINLGILSEQVKGASSGDLITSRTFHIPASKGFLLHEKNEESILYFKENVEAGFYESIPDLLDKIEYFLNNETERLQIAAAGYQRSLKEHSLDQRAQTVISHINSTFKA
ncbi:glycosyltransferase [Algoriphagus sp.]|uniref:CgeB family protein n=1 Tax=Algoriphagus sp. TaxID=1872435 RepID=UPI00391C0239